MDCRFAVVSLCAAGEVPQQPGVDGAEEQVASLGLFASALDVVEDPAHLRACRVGVDTQARGLTPAVRAFIPHELLTDGVRAGVLPDDGVVDRFTGVLVPDDSGFALVGDTDCLNVLGGDVAISESFTDYATGVGPNLLGIVLDPALFREDLLVLHLGDSDDLCVMVEDDAAGGSSSLVNGEDIFAVHHGGYS